MDEGPAGIATQLSEAVVAAFPIYVRGRLQALGVTEDGALTGAIAEATAQLEVQLGRLEGAPLVESPLELVRIATEPITAVLRDQVVAPVTRDERSAEIHPDDIFDLYPATSRDLGEAVWRAHMAWGIERARVVAGMVPAALQESKTGDSAASGEAVPAVALFGLPEPLRSAVAEAVRARGYRPLIWRNPAALDDGLAAGPYLVIVDLDYGEASSAIRLAADTARVVAIGRGVMGFTEAAMMALGAEEVVDSDRILDRLGALLPRLV